MGMGEGSVIGTVETSAGPEATRTPTIKARKGLMMLSRSDAFFTWFACLLMVANGLEYAFVADNPTWLRIWAGTAAPLWLYPIGAPLWRIWTTRR